MSSCHFLHVVLFHHHQFEKDDHVVTRNSHHLQQFTVVTLDKFNKAENIYVKEISGFFALSFFEVLCKII